MEERFKDYEKSIKKVHSFNWTPKYKESYQTALSVEAFIPIAEMAIEKLGWDLVYKDDKTIEAKRKEKSLGLENWTEGISISYDYGKVTVKSESLGNEMWDNGRNSKRVKLFIYAVEELEKSLDKDSIKNIEADFIKNNDWDDYIIPETLPKPTKYKNPNFIILLVGGILLSTLLAFILANISISGIYIIGLFEVGVGLCIGVALKYLIKVSNFTDYNKLHKLLIAIVGLTYLLNQYFQYELILNENNLERIGFLKFLGYRLENGLIIKELNTGWIGLIISWIVQLVLTYYIATMKMINNLNKYQLEKIPIEVVDFAYYHFIKDKTEEQVRAELSSKGWSEQSNQDEVFEAIGALNNVREIGRLK